MVPSKWKHRGAMDSDLTPPRQAVLAPKDSFLQIRHLSSCLLDQTELEVIDGTVEMETPGGDGFVNLHECQTCRSELARRSIELGSRSSSISNPSFQNQYD